jgi:[protein-PII] uridylyltransferase
MLKVPTQAESPHLESLYRDRVLEHAASRFHRNKPQAELFDISGLLRTFLKIEDHRLKTALHFGATGRQTASARSFVLDLVVESAYCEAKRLGEAGGSVAADENECAIVAIGGYGRAELAPFSDLDILILHTGHRASSTRRLVDRILRLLWDARLTIGHSFRTVNECLAAVRNDPHLQTALITTRLLVGNVAAYHSLLGALEKDRRKRGDALVTAIRQERDARHARFSSDVCLQEPNVKDGAGGIRDLHTALWTAYARYGCRTLQELCARELISEADYRRAEEAYDFLWRVRYSLHLATRRKTDRLALDLQPTLAAEFGYRGGSFLLASERLMRDYYRHARELHLFSENLYSRASESEFKWTRRWGRQRGAGLTEPLSITDGRLQLEGDTQFFAKNPLRLFDAFALAQATGLPFGHSLREAIRSGLKRVNREFRCSVETSRAFLQLMRRRGRVAPTLRLMYEVGFLERFIPEFRHISLLIQHDLYHHYTVDEHTFKAIDALDELHTGDDKQHVHLRLISDEIEDIGLLYLSLLFHDIGKGRGSGHIPRGAVIAERICRRLHLDNEAEMKVVSLVRLHVAMAHVAQRRDLNEPQVATDFVAEVGTLDILNMLLLLTYADLHAVGPGVWSEWKGTLLWELYRRSRNLLTGSDAPPDETSRQFKEQVANALEGLLPFSEIERHLALLPDRYVRVTRPDAAATHLHLIEELKRDILALRWLRHGNASTELTICTKDRHGLFADIAGALAAQGIEILGAELNTREDGVVLDVLMLREASTHHSIDGYRYSTIERSLRKVIARELDVATLVEHWRTKNAPRKRAVPAHARRRNLPRVVCDNESSPSSTLVEVHALDEPGLAYKVASVLASLGLDIVCARIATEKSDALDVFYVTDASGEKLSDDMTSSVETNLTNALSSTGKPKGIPESTMASEKRR